MIPTTIATEKLAAKIRRWTLILGGFFAISCLFVSGSALASIVHASRSKSEFSNLKRDIQQKLDTLEKSKHLKIRRLKDRNPDRIQEITDQAARLNGCELLEYQSANETQPYVSKYNTDPPSKVWFQSSIQFQVDGPFTGVFEVIRAICSSPEPVEIDVIDICEGKTRSDEVTAKVTMRLLSMEAPK